MERIESNFVTSFDKTTSNEGIERVFRVLCRMIDSYHFRNEETCSSFLYVRTYLYTKCNENFISRYFSTLINESFDERKKKIPLDGEEKSTRKSSPFETRLRNYRRVARDSLRAVFFCSIN